MAKTVGMFLLLIGLTGAAFATSTDPVPEIDASVGVNALAMVGGACLIVRARKKR